MAITSQDIDNQSFSVERKGYSIQEVDVFLETVSREVGVLNNKIKELEAEKKDAANNSISNEKVEELNRTINEQNEKISKLQAEVKENVDDGRAISEALIVAQRQAEKIVSEANDKSSKIIKDANDKADYIEKEADNQKKKVMSEIEKLEKEQAATSKQYQVMLRDIITAMEKKLASAKDGSGEHHSASSTAKSVPIHEAHAKPATNNQPKANIPAPKAESQKDFSGFGDADFGGDKID